MGDYLALSWPPGTPGKAAEQMRAELQDDPAWRLAHASYGLVVYVRGRGAPSVRPLATRGGVVVGDLFDREATSQGRVSDFPLDLMVGLQPLAAAKILTRHAWGRYVAILRDGARPPWIYRDPTGALEALTWVRDDVTIVSSDVPARGRLAPEGLAIDWGGVGALLARHNLWSQVCPLAGATAVDPGVMRGGVDGEVHRLWRPADAARAPLRDARPQALAQIVDAAVAALARDRQAILVEISGGLDSAIVATSLSRCGAAVAGAINYYWPQPEGDERSWARAIADRCGFGLTTVERDVLAIDGDMLMRHAHGPRPGFNAQDPGLDEDLAQRALVLGADALFSGQGGDGVFYQMAHPALAADILAGAPAPGSRARAMAVLARRARTTVWSLCARALGPFDPAAEGAGPPPYLKPGAAAPPEHAWIADRRGVSRAKQVQIRGLTNAQNAFGDSLRGRAAGLIYPLMSQPVLELCLSIPAPLLAIGQVDRPFARAAFEDRLPPQSLARRSKGAVTQYFAKSVAASLPSLRPFLLEGRLVSQGLIDFEGLEALLDAEAMIWRDVVGEILLAAYLEAWVRVWEAKLSGGAGPDPRLA